VYPVKGKVLLDGKPANGVLLAFFPTAKTAGDIRPNATSGKDGSFALTTRAKNDGAPAGEYAVVAQLDVPVGPADEYRSRQVLPPAYLKPETTPLRAKVEAGPNDLPTFTIKTK
jgi:hypothetical protein